MTRKYEIANHIKDFNKEREFKLSDELQAYLSRRRVGRHQVANNSGQVPSPEGTLSLSIVELNTGVKCSVQAQVLE